MKQAGLLILGVLEVIRGVAGIAITLALLAGVAGGLALGVLGTAPEQVKVPALGRLTVSEASEVVLRSGLTLRVAGREFSGDVQEDRIIRSRPYGGKRVKRGRAVEVIVSLGPRTVSLPKVVGMSLEAAEDRLGQVGLRVSEVRRAASAAPRDQVLEQHPAAGETVGRRDGVVLVASGGAGFGIIEVADGPAWVFRRVRITVPRGAPLQRLQVTLPDAPDEQRAAYDRVQRPGDEVSVSIAGRKGWHVEVRLADKQVFETTL